MCGSNSKKQVVKAESVHDEEGGFHLLEFNSPVHISGSTWILIFAFICCLAGGIYYCYRKEKKSDRKYESRLRSTQEYESPIALRRLAPAPTLPTHKTPDLSSPVSYTHLTLPTIYSV